MFEVFEHTADVGLRVQAEDLSSLFAEAARGLMSLAVEVEVEVENLQEAHPDISTQIELRAGNLEDLLVDWLSKLLELLEQQRLVVCRTDVQVQGNSLTARVAGERLDPLRHHLGQEIKAVTYHQLKVRQTAQGWLTEVILDI